MQNLVLFQMLIKKGRGVREITLGIRGPHLAVRVAGCDLLRITVILLLSL